MKYKKILVTGGAGFVGSSICIQLKKKYKNVKIIALDNLVRRGSELNIPRLQEKGIIFIHGDVREKEDLEIEDIDLIIECSAEPSVMAGVTSSPEYLINTNLLGAINCFELARKNKADVIFLSTSRVYPVDYLNRISFTEEQARFSINATQDLPGVSKNGISEQFPLDKVRTLYGTTKLSAELLLQEYIQNYGIKGVVNRFGLISGPWQMGKIDQGVIVLWMARHVFNKPLSYIGFGGEGKQVRDVIHVDDVFAILSLQIENMQACNGETYNIGGGINNSVSLQELTRYCQQISGNSVEILTDKKTRPGDVRIYITDNKKVEEMFHWKQTKNVEQTLEDVHTWLLDNKNTLKNILE